MLTAKAKTTIRNKLANPFSRFLGFGIQNRRKSRMAFLAFDLRYGRGAITEHRHKPDFLFPGADAYHAAPRNGAAELAMLGAKSSCKDRWRQVLAEAAKIANKHLVTLEPGISVQQTDQMRASALQLIVPDGLMGTYDDAQQKWLWNLSDFIAEIQSRQGAL